MGCARIMFPGSLLLTATIESNGGRSESWGSTTDTVAIEERGLGFTGLWLARNEGMDAYSSP